MAGSGLRHVRVECWREGKILAVYDLPTGISIDPTALPDRNILINEAKTNLSNEHLASPPFENVEFKVFYGS